MLTVKLMHIYLRKISKASQTIVPASLLFSLSIYWHTILPLGMSLITKRKQWSENEAEKVAIYMDCMYTEIVKS